MLGCSPSESSFICSDCSLFVCNDDMMIIDMVKQVGLSGGYWLVVTIVAVTSLSLPAPSTPSVWYSLWSTLHPHREGRSAWCPAVALGPPELKRCDLPSPAGWLWLRWLIITRVLSNTRSVTRPR